MRVAIVRCAAGLALLGAAGCFLDPGRCNYEYRDIELAGTLVASPANPSPIGARVLLAETRGSDPDHRTLSVYFDAATLTGVVSTVELREAGTGRVVASFAGAGFGTGWSANVELGARPTQEELRDLGDEGSLELRLMRTGAPTAVLAGPLAVTARSDWHHLRCD